MTLKFFHVPSLSEVIHFLADNSITLASKNEKGIQILVFEKINPMMTVIEDIIIAKLIFIFVVLKFLNKLSLIFFVFFKKYKES